MKKATLLLLIIITGLTSSAQLSVKKYKKEINKGSYTLYTSIIIEGKEIKNPTINQSIKCMIDYLNNNWIDSNVYRAQFIHLSINYKKSNSNNI